MKKSEKSLSGLGSFLLGFTTGSLAIFLYATHGGRVFRTIMKNDTDLIVENAIEKKNELIDKVRGLIHLAGDNINNTYKNSKRKIDIELMSIKAGFSIALDTYRKTRKTDKHIYDITEDYLYDDEYDSLPKHESMKRRGEKENY